MNIILNSYDFSLYVVLAFNILLNNFVIFRKCMIVYSDSTQKRCQNFGICLGLAFRFGNAGTTLCPAISW